jgi:hypothetical protein
MRRRQSPIQIGLVNAISERGASVNEGRKHIAPDKPSKLIRQAATDWIALFDVHAAKS